MDVKRKLVIFLILPFLLSVGYVALAVRGTPQILLADSLASNQKTSKSDWGNAQGQDLTSQLVTRPSAQITPTMAFTSYLPIVMKWEPLPPAGVYILDNHSSYAHPDNGFSVVGEVWNNTSNYLQDVKVTVKFYNDQGQLVGSDFNSELDLPPGHKRCFRISDYLSGIYWAYYEFDALSYQPDGTSYPMVTAFNVNGYLETEKRYHILGEVRNDDNAVVKYVTVIGALYNASGTVLDCRLKYADISTLSPGETSSFELYFTWRDAGYVDVSYYRVEVKARYFE